MVLRLTTAHSSKPGTVLLIEGEAATVKSNDISKTGKHGASKCRIEAIEIFSGKKKVIAVPGDTKFEVKGQVAVEKQVEYWDIEGKKMIMRVF